MARNRHGTDKCTTIEIDVDLKDEGLSHEGVKRLVIQLVKHLLFQKKQIPHTVESIQKDVKSDTETGSAGSETAKEMSSGGGPAMAQQLLRQKRMANKQLRIRQKYLVRAKSFFERYQAFEDDILRHLDRNSTSLCCVFGASPAHPKEVYTIELPAVATWALASSEKANRRAMLTLFRAMATNEALFKMLDGNTFLSTNLFVGLKKPPPYQSNGDHLVKRPGFRSSSARCRFAVIRLRQDGPAPDNYPEWSPLETPLQPRRFTVLATPSSRCTPVPMDMCTPLVSQRHVKFQTPGVATALDLMMETPCVKRNKCTAIAEEETEIEVAPSEETPLVSQRHVKLQTQTPGVATALDLMMETPCVKRNKCSAITEEVEEEELEIEVTPREGTPVTDSFEWMFIPNSLKGFAFPKV